MRKTFLLVGPIACLLLTLQAGAEPEIVEFTTADGVVLNARYYAAEGELSSAVIYVHQPGRSSRDWDYMATKLAAKGIAGLAPDLRGHGDSLSTEGGGEVDRELFEADDYHAMVQDVAAAVSYLRKTRGFNGTPVQLVGADVGGSVALLYAVDDKQIETLTLLSPGLMYDSVDIVGQVAAYGGRPLMFVVSVEDSYSVKSSDVLADEARGVFHKQTYFGVGHGTKMLNREPDLEQLLDSWLMGTFKTKDGLTLAETLRLNAQDRGAGLEDSTASLAQEQLERAQRDRETEESDEKKHKDSAVDGADDTPTRWD